VGEAEDILSWTWSWRSLNDGGEEALMLGWEVEIGKERKKKKETEEDGEEVFTMQTSLSSSALRTMSHDP
jgi:hypothetical protein